jgi:hypothetical protein
MLKGILTRALTLTVSRMLLHRGTVFTRELCANEKQELTREKLARVKSHSKRSGTTKPSWRKLRSEVTAVMRLILSWRMLMDVAYNSPCLFVCACACTVCAVRAVCVLCMRVVCAACVLHVCCMCAVCAVCVLCALCVYCVCCACTVCVKCV